MRELKKRCFQEPFRRNLLENELQRTKATRGAGDRGGAINAEYGVELRLGEGSERESRGALYGLATS